MDIQYTSFDPTLDDPTIGYGTNLKLSPQLVSRIQHVQNALEQRFGDAIFLPSSEALHSTLTSWISTKLAGGKDVDSLFNEVRADYTQSFKSALEGIEPFTISFHELRVTSKTVTLVGADAGQFQRIREGWNRNIIPTELTPPLTNIVHTVIAVFRESLDVALVDKTIRQHEITYDERVDSFRLVRETKMRMQEFSVLEHYFL